jgi:hypothetical protein
MPKDSPAGQTGAKKNKKNGGFEQAPGVRFFEEFKKFVLLDGTLIWMSCESCIKSKFYVSLRRQFSWSFLLLSLDVQPSFISFTKSGGR